MYSHLRHVSVLPSNKTRPINFWLNKSIKVYHQNFYSCINLYVRAGCHICKSLYHVYRLATCEETEVYIMYGGRH
jgi:hypothetical protein